MSEQKELSPEHQARLDVICEQVAERKTVREIAEGFGVNAGTIIKWVSVNDQSTQQYMRAREAAADLFESDILEAAQAATTETAAADRIKIDTLKWIAARRCSKKYGDKVDHTSSDGSMSPKPTIIELTGPTTAQE